MSRFPVDAFSEAITRYSVQLAAERVSARKCRRRAAFLAKRSRRALVLRVAQTLRSRLVLGSA